jgi:hypothetical protein
MGSISGVRWRCPARSAMSPSPSFLATVPPISVTAAEARAS